MTLVYQSIGMTKVIPIFLFGAVLLLYAVLVFAAPVFVATVFAAPPTETFPSAGKPQLEREPTVLEQAVDRAAVMLLNGKLPPTEDGVRFALWLYGEKSDVAYLDIATKMARDLVKTDPIMGTAACSGLRKRAAQRWRKQSPGRMQHHRHMPRHARRMQRLRLRPRRQAWLGISFNSLALRPDERPCRTTRGIR